MTAFRVTTDVHRRRFSRNLGTGLALGGLIALVFALTMVKVTNLGPATLEGYDHQFRPAMTAPDAGAGR